MFYSKGMLKLQGTEEVKQLILDYQDLTDKNLKKLTDFSNP
jgi:hypothetical protein